jgi:hypothetical protein
LLWWWWVVWQGSYLMFSNLSLLLDLHSSRSRTSLHDDDETIFFNPIIQNMNTIMKILEFFGNASGCLAHVACPTFLSKLMCIQSFMSNMTLAMQHLMARQLRQKMVWCERRAWTVWKILIRIPLLLSFLCKTK